MEIFASFAFQFFATLREPQSAPLTKRFSQSREAQKIVRRKAESTIFSVPLQTRHLG